MSSPPGGDPEQELASGKAFDFKQYILKQWGVKPIKTLGASRRLHGFDIDTFYGHNVFNQFLTTRPRWFSVCTMDTPDIECLAVSAILHAIRAGQIFARHASNTYIPTHAILPLLDGTMLHVSNRTSTLADASSTISQVKFVLVHFDDADPYNIIPDYDIENVRVCPFNSVPEFNYETKARFLRQLNTFLGAPRTEVFSRCTSFATLAKLFPNATSSRASIQDSVLLTTSNPPPRVLETFIYAPSMYPIHWDAGLIPYRLPNGSIDSCILHPLLVLQKHFSCPTFGIPPLAADVLLLPRTVAPLASPSIPPSLPTGTQVPEFARLLPVALLHLRKEGRIGPVLLDWGGGNQRVLGKPGALARARYPHDPPTSASVAFGSSNDMGNASVPDVQHTRDTHTTTPVSALSSPPYVLRFGPLAYESERDGGESNVAPESNGAEGGASGRPDSGDFPFSTLFPSEPHQQGSEKIFHPFAQAVPLTNDELASLSTSTSTTPIPSTRMVPPLSIGRYLEHRAFYTAPQFQPKPDESNAHTQHQPQQPRECRTVHLGIDVGVEVPLQTRNPLPTPSHDSTPNASDTCSASATTGTHTGIGAPGTHATPFAPGDASVYTPLPGTVHSWSFAPDKQGYGVCVMIEHRLEAQIGLSLTPAVKSDSTSSTEKCRTVKGTFYTLYGHLSLASLYEEASADGCTSPRLQVGDPVAPVNLGGTPIGGVGDVSENGGWPSHLHFQLIASDSLFGYSGTFPGVCERSRVREYVHLCPDPNLLLGCPFLPLFISQSCLFPSISSVHVK